MKNSALSNPSKMNALKSGYFAIFSIEECENDSFFQEVFQDLMHDIAPDAADKIVIAKEIAFYRLKQKQLAEAMDHYQKKWFYKQRSAKDLAQRATGGRAPLMTKPDLSILYRMQGKSNSIRQKIIQESAESIKELDEKMQMMRTHYSKISQEFIISMSQNEASRIEKKDLRLVNTFARQAMKFMEFDYQIAQNQNIYARYGDEILTYLDAMPTIPDTGHWRNMISEGDKIQEKLDFLTQKLQDLSQDESKNSLSETESRNAVKSQLKHEINTEMTKMDQNLEDFNTESHIVTEPHQNISD